LAGAPSSTAQQRLTSTGFRSAFGIRLRVDLARGLNPMDWKHQIGGCFGPVDHVFAAHPLDENRAFALLTSLRVHGIAWAKVEPEFRAWLEHKRCSADH